MRIPAIYKECIRYIIIVVIMIGVQDLAVKAYELELAGKLTMQFAGIVISAGGVLTLVLGSIFKTTVGE